MSASSPYQDIVAALARSLGQEHALKLVSVHARRLGLHVERLTREQAMRVLDDIANEPGLVGITGRFAKIRIDMNTK